MKPTLSLAPLLASAIALCMFSGTAFSAGGCDEARFCEETSAFAAALTDFRTSTSGGYRVLTATVNFQNKTDRPLVLGYVAQSGVALDEHGNRYIVKDERNVRGIGEIRRNTFDPKFTLQPGERSDARFDLSWYAGKHIAGVKFDLELTVREIDEVTGNQHRLGKEHALRFAGLADGVGALTDTSPAEASSSAVAPPAASAVASTTAAPADPCAGLAQCRAAGPFLAQLLQVSGSRESNYHLVRVGFKLRNLTNQPLILAYQARSGTMLDNYGNRYAVDWRYNDRVKGIGQTTGREADPQFVLSPGESRNISLEYSRYVGKSAIGTVFSPDLVVEQLEILPSQQIRSMREYAISFANISSASPGPATAVGSDATEAIDEISEAGRKLGEGLKGLFKRK